MNAPNKSLADDAARRQATSEIGSSFLVEAGAGSGKTAIMAGRIAIMLACGVAPRSIAAVTFTELAASELMLRVEEFVSQLGAGIVPTELALALPNGLSEEHKKHLAAARDTLDEMTCSTIHGFCQNLVRPYPVEAGIDPGATVLDRKQADTIFLEIADAALRERLESSGTLLAEFVMYEPDKALGIAHDILEQLRRRPDLLAPAPRAIEPLLQQLGAAVRQYAAYINQKKSDPRPVIEEGTAECVAQFKELVSKTSFAQVGSAELVKILTLKTGKPLCKDDGSFYVFKRKGKWEDAAKLAGYAKNDGTRFYTEVEALHSACCALWDAIRAHAASRALGMLLDELRPVVAAYQDYKREAAMFDFDDQIRSASALLREHRDVRDALAARYQHILVDEFQDTDTVQMEIFWRLAGDIDAVSADATWDGYPIRPGALFLVGDPKQAIYRFRGADVQAYVKAKEAFVAQDPGSVLSISTNFRSCAPILTYVNERFEGPLSTQGQPGFSALSAYHPPREDVPCVAKLDVKVEPDADANAMRDAEADAVAQMCARLIGAASITDRRTRETRVCRPGDIALLAPTGSDLWRYEEALEALGIPVATQAGKGLFRRQEIQDMLALTRLLADSGDNLALAAFLRGPVVGLSDEALLDIVAALPTGEGGQFSRLKLHVDLELLSNPYAKDIFSRLQTLARKANSTTPYQLLKEAVDVLRIRAVLRQRHGAQAERALANIDQYLSFSKPYQVRGLRAFARAMTEAWEEKESAAEGAPDAEAEAVSLFTIHAAKGLEWPIVVPINTMTRTVATDSILVDRPTNTLYAKVFGVGTTGYEDAHQAEKNELDRERLRLWYVAATRAREVLVLPYLEGARLASNAWLRLMDLSIDRLESLDLSKLPPVQAAQAAQTPVPQEAKVFADEAAKLHGAIQHLEWVAPSRAEAEEGGVMPDGGPGYNVFVEGAEDHEEPLQVQGSRLRGLVMHKLFEDVLNGEVANDLDSLTKHVDALLQDLGLTSNDDASVAMNAAEIAGCVSRSLALPEIAALLPHLVAELPVYAARKDNGSERVLVGVADAAAIVGGRAKAIVDWKSDVDPRAETVAHYMCQVQDYLDMTGADIGYVVLATSGGVIAVQPSK